MLDLRLEAVPYRIREPPEEVLPHQPYRLLHNALLLHGDGRERDLEPLRLAGVQPRLARHVVVSLSLSRLILKDLTWLSFSITRQARKGYVVAL